MKSNNKGGRRLSTSYGKWIAELSAKKMLEKHLLLL